MLELSTTFFSQFDALSHCRLSQELASLWVLHKLGKRIARVRVTVDHLRRSPSTKFFSCIMPRPTAVVEAAMSTAQIGEV
jgi:hypothetical protein